jgi:hypothetical protein
MARRGAKDEELKIKNLVQVTLMLSEEDIRLWDLYSATSGYTTAITARDCFRAGLIVKIAESRSVMEWEALISQQSDCE